MMRPNMAWRYWLYSVVPAIGALAMVAGIAWLDRASSNHVDIAAFPPPPQVVPAFPKPFAKRQDVDVLLAVDFSGSMLGSGGEPATDPDGLRLQAAELMVASLASDVFPRATRMGYIAFGEGTDLIQLLASVEDPDARKALIAKLRTPSYSDYTNIVDTLRAAYDQLFPGGNRTSKNLPALVLLTDGDPRGGPPNNNEAGIRKAIRDLTDKGTIIFVVILRNPDPGQERPRLGEWRRIWKSLADRNPRLRYFEAQRADELEDIYNRIRARLVNEGARPGERVTYDPKDPASAIKMPPNLLQAHLLVGKPHTASHMDLIAPDGTTFSALARQDKRNELLVSDLYYRYRIYRPEEGNWRLETDSSEPIAYLLNPESLYSARIKWPAGSPYLSPDAPTQLSLVVIDPDGKPTSKEFDLGASVLRNTERADGAIIEEEIPLPAPQRQPDGLTYQTEVGPDTIGTDTTVTVQISGEADDGTLVNVSLMQLPVVRTPTGVVLQLPGRVVCSDETLHLWPPEIRCGNLLAATLQVEGDDRLLPDSLSGELFPPGRRTGVAMRKVDSSTLQQTFGPLATAGNYEVAAEASGKVGEGLIWKGRSEAKVELVWPAWVERWRKQLSIGAVLLAVCALWKPLFVALLLPLFRLLRLAPSGFYSVSGDNYSDAAYRTAMQRRKLLTLTMGRWENRSLDVRVDDGPRTEPDRPRRGIRRLLPDTGGWLHRQPLGRLVAAPFKGLYAETCDGFEQAPDRRPMRMSVGRTKVLVCQSDWTERPG